MLFPLPGRANDALVEGLLNGLISGIVAHEVQKSRQPSPPPAPSSTRSSPPRRSTPPEYSTDGLTRQQRVEVQQRLNSLGYQVGTADGVFGGKTRQGIRTFEVSMPGAIQDGVLQPHEMEYLVAMVARQATASNSVSQGTSVTVPLLYDPSRIPAANHGANSLVASSGTSDQLGSADTIAAVGQRSDGGLPTFSGSSILGHVSEAPQGRESSLPTFSSVASPESAPEPDTQGSSQVLPVIQESFGRGPETFQILGVSLGMLRDQVLANLPEKWRSAPASGEVLSLTAEDKLVRFATFRASTAEELQEVFPLSPEGFLVEEEREIGRKQNKETLHLGFDAQGRLFHVAVIFPRLGEHQYSSVLSRMVEKFGAPTDFQSLNYGARHRQTAVSHRVKPFAVGRSLAFDDDCAPQMDRFDYFQSSRAFQELVEDKFESFSHATAAEIAADRNFKDQRRAVTNDLRACLVASDSKWRSLSSASELLSRISNDGTYSPRMDLMAWNCSPAMSDETFRTREKLRASNRNKHFVKAFIANHQENSFCSVIGGPLGIAATVFDFKSLLDARGIGEKRDVAVEF